jgi:hypothetical protein
MSKKEWPLHNNAPISVVVRLVSQKGEQFDVSLEVAKMSELVKTMFDGIFLLFCPFITKLTSFLCREHDQREDT